MIDPNPKLPAGARLQHEVAVVPTILASARPPALSAAPDAMGLLMALRRRWRIGVGLGILSAVAAGVSTWYIVPKSKYTARATLHVSSNPKYIIFDPKERLTDYRTYQRTQVALAKSHFVLADALKRPELAGLTTLREQVDPSDWLSQQIKVDFPDASEVLEISLTGERPEDLALLVNAAVDSYMSRVVEEEEKERHARLEKLRELWEKYQHNLQSKRDQFRKLSDELGTADQKTLSVAQQSKIQHRELAESELMRMKFELRRSESELAVLEDRVEESISQGTSQAAVDERIDAHPHVIEIHSQIRKLLDRQSQVSRLTPRRDDPALLSVRRQLDQAKKDLSKARSTLRPHITSQLHSTIAQEDRDTVAKLRARVSSTRMYMDAITQEIERVQEESKAINRTGLDLTQYQDEIQIVGETARKIGAEVEAMEVELGAPARIRVVDRAIVPTIKDKFRKAKASGAAAVGTLMLILFGVSFREFRARRINTVDEVAQGLGLKIVGSLPPLPNGSRESTAPTALRLRSQLLESIDSTRTMILHASRTEGIRMVMVTSAMKGEGKSTLSYHLATSLARIGRRTLLIDGDLRCPTMHQFFDIPLNPGLSELLRGEFGANDVIWSTHPGGPDVLPAGDCCPLAIHALAQDQIRILFEELKTRYDFIIVDSPPVLSVADSLLLGQVVDAVLFSILRDVSRVPMVYAASERLLALGARMLGAVVSGVSDDSDSSAYSYSSKYFKDANSAALLPGRATELAVRDKAHRPQSKP